MLGLDKEESYQRIIKARRILDELGNDCKIIEDVSFFQGDWLLLIDLKNRGKVTSDFPLMTSWYIRISIDYPEGGITFYPAKKGGISKIYPHQSPHTPQNETSLFFASNLCLEQYEPGLKAESNDSNRLYHYVVQALEWIRRASLNELVRDGEAFELVAYPNDNRKKIVFAEQREQFLQWEKLTQNKGFCNIKVGSIEQNQHQKLFYITDFFAGSTSYKKADKKIMSYKWGNYVAGEKSGEQKGVWLRLKKMPKLEPWQAPKTWHDLIILLKESGIDFKKDVMPLLNEIRDGLYHFMVLGFPIPMKFGDVNQEYFWQGISLPKLSNHQSANSYFKGFRKNKVGYEYVDMNNLFSKTNEITWVKSENWSENSLTSRGAITPKIGQLKYLIIGVGALGSTIAELLVRLGATNIDVIDSDILKMGNLVRHRLLASDIDKAKAIQMHKRLSGSNIHYIGNYFAESLEEFIKRDSSALQEYDVIIETTGDDKLLNVLSNVDLKSVVCSISIGLGAKHLYVYSTSLEKIDEEMFSKKIQPFLKLDSEDFPAESFPRDGIGCWHPLFPARIDHIEILSGIAINILEEDLNKNKNYITVIELGKLGLVKEVMREQVL